MMTSIGLADMRGAAGAGFMVGALFNVLAGMLGARVRAGRPQDAAPESTGEQAAPGVVPDSIAQNAPVRPPESPGQSAPPLTSPAASCWLWTPEWA